MTAEILFNYLNIKLFKFIIFDVGTNVQNMQYMH